MILHNIGLQLSGQPAEMADGLRKKASISSQIFAMRTNMRFLGLFSICLFFPFFNGQFTWLDDGCTLEVTANITPISCFGERDGAVEISVSGGIGPYTYVWSDGVINPDRSELGPGNYGLTVVDAEGCEHTLALILTEPDLLRANASASAETGEGAADGSAEADPRGGTSPYSYQWSNGDTLADIDNLIPGNYTVLLTDANGCTSEETVVVGSFACTGVDVLVAVSDAACFGICDGSVMAAGQQGEGPYNYAWSNGLAGQDIVSLCAGIYSVTLTDANGCQAIENFVLEQPRELILRRVESQEFDCGVASGQTTVEATGGTPPYHYVWQDGSTGPSNTLCLSTFCRVTVTDANGCTDDLTVPIVTPNSLEIVTNSNDVSCFGGSDGTAFIQIAGGQPPYTYQWSDSTLISQDSVDMLSAGTYTITLTDATGCSVSSTFFIDEPSPIDIIPFIENETGVGQNGFINVTVFGGTAPYTYVWTLNGQPFSTNEDLNNLSAGEYELLLTDANGCTVSSGILTIDNLVATHKPEWADKIQLLPNPSRGRFRLEVQLPQAAWVQLDIYDLRGQKLMDAPSSKTKEGSYAFDLSAYPPGTYLLCIRIEDKMLTRKIIINR